MTRSLLVRFAMLALAMVMAIAIAFVLRPGPEVCRWPSPELVRSGGVLYRNDRGWSGFVERHYPSGGLKERSRYRQGRRSARSVTYHEGGTQASERFFRDGHKNGAQRGWWPNGRMKFSRVYVRGRAQGMATEWYDSGQRATVHRYVDGKEDGRQVGWTQDGRIHFNYEIVDGRRYGLIGSKPCFTIRNAASDLDLDEL